MHLMQRAIMCKGFLLFQFMNKTQDENIFGTHESSLFNGRNHEPVFTRILFWCGLLFLLFYVFPHLEFLKHANEMPRLFMTESLVRENDMGVDSQLREYHYNKQMDLSRSFCLSNRIFDAAGRSMVRSGLGNPNLEGRCEERTHPNKAPAQSFLGVPFYMLSMSWASLTGAHHSLGMKLWWLRFGTSLLPLIFLLFMMERLLKRWIPESHPRRVALAAYGVGSMAMVYGMQLMSHSLAAFFLFGAFFFLCPAPGNSGRGDTAPPFYNLILAGFFAGSAIASDYQAGFGAAILAIYGVYRVRFNIRLVWGIIGGAVPLFLLGFYHYHAYGSPFWTGYRFLIAVDDHALHARGFMGIVGPQKGPFWAVLFSARDGLVFLSPWTLFAVLGLYRMLSPPRELPRSHCSCNIIGGESSGRRILNIYWWKLAGSILAVVSGITAVYKAAGSGAAPWTDPYLNALGWFLAIWAIIGMACAVRFPVKSSGKASGFADVALGSVIVACGLTAPVLVGFDQAGVWSVTLPLLAACWSFVSGKGAAPVENIHGKGRAVFVIPIVFVFCIAIILSGSVSSGYPLLVLRATMWAAAAAWVLLCKTNVAKMGGYEKTIGVPESLVVFAMISFYVWFVSSVTFWHGGWQVGPRYLAVMLPFLTIGAAVAFQDSWQRGSVWWIWVTAAISVSIVIYTLTAAVFPHFPKSFINPFYDLVGYLLSRGYVAHNAGEYLFNWRGISSLWPYFAVTGALLLFLAVGSGVQMGRRWTERPVAGNGDFGVAFGRRWVYGVLGLAAAVFVLEGYRALPRADFQQCCGWITKMWDVESDKKRGSLNKTKPQTGRNTGHRRMQTVSNVKLREPSAPRNNDRSPPSVRSGEEQYLREARSALFQPMNSSHRNEVR